METFHFGSTLRQTKLNTLLGLRSAGTLQGLMKKLPALLRFMENISINILLKRHVLVKKRIDNAIEFFKHRKVLFAAVWEGCLKIGDLYAYLCEDLSFEQLLDRFKFEDVHEVDANRTKKRRKRQSNDADKGRIIETGTSKKKRLLSKYNELKTQYPPESHHDEVLLLESVVNDFGLFNMND